MDFSGAISWIQWKATTDFDPNNWEAIDAVRTKIGTNPVGSEWTKITLPEHEPVKGSGGWAFKDLVVVPEDLEPGQMFCLGGGIAKIRHRSGVLALTSTLSNFFSAFVLLDF